MKIYSLIIISFFCNSIFSQFDNEIDSLKREIKFATTAEKVLLYSQLFDKTYKNIDLARMYLDSMRIESKKDNSSLHLGLILRNEGTYFARINRYKNSEDSIRKSVQIFEKLNNKTELAHSYNNLGLTLRSLGQLDSAMYYNIKSLKIREDLGVSPEIIAKNYTTIGVLHGILYNFREANSYFLKAEKIYLKSEDTWRLAAVWNKLGLNNKLDKNHTQALYYYHKADSLFRVDKNLTYISIVTNNIGVIYLEMDSLKLAENYFMDALLYGKKAQTDRRISSALLNLGFVKYKKKKYKEALDYYEKALAIAEVTGVLKQKENLYRNMTDAYSGLKNYKKALQYKELFFEVYDSIFNIESHAKINELEAKYQTEKKESEIALQDEEINTLNEKAKVDKLTKSLYAGGAFFGVTLSGLLFFGFRQRIKKNKIAREKQDEIYKQEIAHKKKELTSQTLHLVQKNTFIRELMENFESIKNSPEKFKMEFRRIVMLLKKENASDKDWEVFKTYFAEVHNDFDQKLKTLYADISEKEIRLAAFLRMNLTTKEIAATLNVLPDSILKSKYRLKKKLNINKETDLTSFLNTI